MLARAPGFEEALLVVDVEPRRRVGRRLRDVRRRALAREREAAARGADRSTSAPAHRSKAPVERQIAPLLDDLEQMRLGARARPARLRREERLPATSSIGVSGGIDSALDAAIAVEALGPERVHCVSMPSRYSLRGDACRRAAARREPRQSTSASSRSSRSSRRSPRRCADVFAGREPDLTEENIQARVRGVLLMALSNKFGWLVVATGNKSELSVGYATLYGDMAGGFALLKDVFKTDVFRLAQAPERARRARAHPADDHRSGAERRAARRTSCDEDSLPPYPELDRVLEEYVELDRSREDLIARRIRPRRRRPRARADRPGRVQAAPGPARRASCARRRSGATGACRSRTAGRAETARPDDS